MKERREDVIETVMTYDQWKKEVVRRCKKRFVRRWNKGIENIRETLHSFSLRKAVVTAYATTGIILGLFVSQYAVNADMGAECVRVSNGTYYDYMAIVTSDGEEWLLDDSNPSENRYMEPKENGIYMPIFENRESVRVTFDTMGTEDITDDEITNVESLEGIKDIMVVLGVCAVPAIALYVYNRKKGN